MVVTLQALNRTKCSVAREKCPYNETGHGKAFETCIYLYCSQNNHHTQTHSLCVLDGSSTWRVHTVLLFSLASIPDLTLVHWKQNLISMFMFCALNTEKFFII